MTEIDAYQEYIRCKHNAFCKAVIRYAAQRFLFVLKTGEFQKIWGAFLPTKKRLRKQKTDSEGNLSRFFCF